MYDKFRIIPIVGFRAVRAADIKAIEAGEVEHEARDETVDDKNLLLTGEVTLDDVVRLLKKCRGPQYSHSPHHSKPEIDVHVFKPIEQLPGDSSREWYIKLYFVEPAVWFISVHLSTGKKDP